MYRRHARLPAFSTDLNDFGGLRPHQNHTQQASQNAGQADEAYLSIGHGQHASKHLPPHLRAEEGQKPFNDQHQAERQQQGLRQDESALLARRGRSRTTARTPHGLEEVAAWVNDHHVRFVAEAAAISLELAVELSELRVAAKSIRIQS